MFGFSNGGSDKTSSLNKSHWCWKHLTNIFHNFQIFKHAAQKSDLCFVTLEHLDMRGKRIPLQRMHSHLPSGYIIYYCQRCRCSGSFTNCLLLLLLIHRGLRKTLTSIVFFFTFEMSSSTLPLPLTEGRKVSTGPQWTFKSLLTVTDLSPPEEAGFAAVLLQCWEVQRSST